MFSASIDSIAIGGTTIVRSVEFMALPGEVTAIIGPNGSGKSTLLKGLSGDLHFKGRVAINGQDSRSLRSWETASLRAVLPQHSTLSFPFTVREVVAMGLTGGRSGVSNAEREWLPERALERVDLAGCSGRFYSDLSGGEQQRVQLARVLCQVWQPVLDGAPRYLLLDEPVSSLDVKHQILVMKIARDFADAGGGVVAILHDLNLAGRFADRILAMRAGTAAGFGAPDDVLTDERMTDVFDCPIRFHRDDAGLFVRLG
ncbi:heme ABC transporter ATP-binding protein [Devosia sp. CN2-171]|uniref:heme ABC transporter ATP-binding protein n=1 Tax=Devosia sp. CN2-171 TaxID=3400909 RepID=UPI003BF7AF04